MGLTDKQGLVKWAFAYQGGGTAPARPSGLASESKAQIQIKTKRWEHTPKPENG